MLIPLGGTLGSILHSVEMGYNLREPVLYVNVFLINCLTNVPSLRGGDGGRSVRVYHGETSP